MLCVLKIIAELGIEYTLIVSTAYENDSYYLVMDFTALMVIQYIDQSYFDSYNDPLKDVLIEEFNFELPVTKTNVTYKELDIREKIYLGTT